MDDLDEMVEEFVADAYNEATVALLHRMLYGFTEPVTLPAHPKQPPLPMPSRAQISAAVRECMSNSVAEAYSKMLLDGVLMPPHIPKQRYDVWDDLGQEIVVDLGALNEVPTAAWTPETPLPTDAEIRALFGAVPQPQPLVISPHAYRKANRLLGRPENAMGLTSADVYRAAEIEFEQAQERS